MICEFNPFHNGHKFLLEKIKQDCAEEIVCVMSGNMVQRGELAITDKFSRTKAALRYGADMVIELPAVYAMSSAQVFAANGVKLAYESGCDKLCFGAENSIEELYTALRAIDSDEAQEKIATSMKEGDYYPRAVAQAVGEELAAVVEKPNNILAFEYIRACAEYGIEPIAIPREGTYHDSREASGSIASGSKIRDMILSGEDASVYTPMDIERPAYPDYIAAAVLYNLKTTSAQELKKLPDVSEGLENRIIEIAKNYNYLSEILDELKTKRYTMARLRRILMYSLLGITRDMQNIPVPYSRVLGARSDKKHLLSAHDIPVIADVRRGYDSLDERAKEIFDIDIKASALMSIATGRSLNEFSEGMIII